MNLKSTFKFITLLIILITHTTSNKNLSTLKSARNDDSAEMTNMKEVLALIGQSAVSNRSKLPHFKTYSTRYKRKRRNQRLQGPSTLPDDEDKRKLAKLMKERFLQFRKQLEESKEQQDPVPKGETTIPQSSFQLFLHQTPLRHPIYGSSIFESTKIPAKDFPTVAIKSSNPSALNMAKQLRSADEATSSSRSSGIRPVSLPFTPIARPLLSPLTTSSAQASQRASETATHKVLEERLGPSAPPNFDPSIVVDFYSLLQLTRQSQGLKRSKPHQGRNLKTSLEVRAEPQVLLHSKSSEEVRVVRRKLADQPLPLNLPTDEKASSDHKSKRAQYLQLPSNIAQNSSTNFDELSLYISTNTESDKPSKERKAAMSEFGPHSDGNDP